ncbi:MAG: hypothetical protein JWN48_4569 [Myxococcaceae bacterium]|nr:hypothetical protein [Myxococcaceae bacterium]
MPVFGRKKQLSYQMFDVRRSADEAKRFVRCERLYHQGQEFAWDGKEILSMLLAQHGGVQLPDDKREALKQLLAIILWGELAAWKISAQLADELEPLEAKMAATSQAHDEARHFYTMHDYLEQLGYQPGPLDAAPEALLELVLGTSRMAEKLVGMQLMVETIALSIFQAVRESNVEPVLCELLKYYERDEARHVGLGMQYLPELLRPMSRLEVLSLSAFQLRLMRHALAEAKLLAPQLACLGIDVRTVLVRVRRKQIAAMQEAFRTVGMKLDRDDNLITRGLDAAIAYAFPEHKQASVVTRMRAAYGVLSRRGTPVLTRAEFRDHEQHVIKTARGAWVGPTATSAHDAGE